MAEASADPNNAFDWDDPLQDEVLRAEQLEVLSNLGRCRYQDTAQHIMKHFEEVSRLGQQGSINQAVFDKKITWIVYMMGALVGGHASAKANRADTDCAPTHVVNGELAGRIFRMVNLTGGGRRVRRLRRCVLARQRFLQLRTQTIAASLPTLQRPGRQCPVIESYLFTATDLGGSIGNSAISSERCLPSNSCCQPLRSVRLCHQASHVSTRKKRSCWQRRP